MPTFKPASFKEQLLYQRAFEAVLWALPAEDTLVMSLARRERGMKEGAVFYFENRATGKTELITFNNQTPYVFGTLSTRNGLLVFDVPAARRVTRCRRCRVSSGFLTSASTPPPRPILIEAGRCRTSSR
jgi:hypothetical protein